MRSGIKSSSRSNNTASLYAGLGRGPSTNPAGVVGHITTCVGGIMRDGKLPESVPDCTGEVIGSGQWGDNPAQGEPGRWGEGVGLVGIWRGDEEWEWGYKLGVSLSG